MRDWRLILYCSADFGTHRLFVPVASRYSRWKALHVRERLQWISAEPAMDLLWANADGIVRLLVGLVMRLHLNYI
jgi:hypothetical protein